MLRAGIAVDGQEEVAQSQLLWWDIIHPSVSAFPEWKCWKFGMLLGPAVPAWQHRALLGFRN